MDGNGSLFGTLSGNTRTVIHKFTVDLPKKHRECVAHVARGEGDMEALQTADGPCATQDVVVSRRCVSRVCETRRGTTTCARSPRPPRATF